MLCAVDFSATDRLRYTTKIKSGLCWFPIQLNHRRRMRMAGFRPSNHRIAILYVVFMACSLALLCYQSRLSRILPLDTPSRSLAQSVKMTREGAMLSVMDALDDDAREDTGSKQLSHAPDAVSDDEARLSILSPPVVLPDHQLDLVAYSGYRRPPPTRQ